MLLALGDVNVEVAVFDDRKFVVVYVSEQDDAVPVLGDVHPASDVDFFWSHAADWDDTQLRQAANEVVDGAVTRPFDVASGVDQRLFCEALVIFVTCWQVNKSGILYIAGLPIDESGRHRVLSDEEPVADANLRRRVICDVDGADGTHDIVEERQSLWSAVFPFDVVDLGLFHDVERGETTLRPASKVGFGQFLFAIRGGGPPIASMM